jgi:predicted GIY-YIG superfamily endonuclease
MPAKKNQIVGEYARMWPREVFDCLITNENGRRKRILGKGLDLVNEPGVYVLYRDDIPYYIGQATKLRHRLWLHAGSPGARYGNFWNYFSAFVIHDPKMRNEVEGILIAAMPTANSAKPKLKRAKYPLVVSQMVRRIRKDRASPVVR